MPPRPRPLLQRYGRGRIAKDGVAVAIRIDLVVLEGVDSAGVVEAIIRVIRDRGTAKHDGAVCILIQEAVTIVADLIVVEGHDDTTLRATATTPLPPVLLLRTLLEMLMAAEL